MYKKMLKKIRCRKCKAETKVIGFYYKCKVKECSTMFWHRKVLDMFDNKEPVDSEKNKKIEAKIIKDSKLPYKFNGKRNTYVLALSKKDTEDKRAVYVGESANHPMRRYLQHIRGYKKAKRGNIVNRAKFLLSYELGFKPEEAKKREKELKKILLKKYIVYGGH